LSKEFSAVELIVAKREKQELSTEQINWLVANYTSGVVADEQMSAMAMAILLNGMNRREIRDLTLAMIASGERLDFSSLTIPTADKHSTGGVGDKITLMLAPLVAVFGVAVPQLSGRGLGHTGGTLDKLEAIPGWQASITNQKMHDQLPLIASSIMSKKIAEGTSALVLDVKVGSGAFMKTLERAQELAQVLTQLGADAGVKTSALLTDMSTPLGRKVGNALEVDEAVEVLSGGGSQDLIDITVELAREMLRLSGKTDVDVAAALNDGRAMDKWNEMIKAQHGDPTAKLQVAKHEHTILAESSGYVNELDALAVGTASWRLGAGRARKEDPVQFGAGIILHAKRGEKIEKGAPLLTLYTDEEERFDRAVEALSGGIKIESELSTSFTPLILDRINA